MKILISGGTGQLGRDCTEVLGKNHAVTPVGSKAQGVTIDLPAPAVWDGVAAADGRLYVSLKNGTVVCYE